MAGNENFAGLSSEEAARRKREGRSNGEFAIRTKSVKQIFAENIFTFFNIVNIVLAALVLTFGSVKDALFMGVIILNIAIGIIQEIRSKRVIDRLSLICAPKARLLRDGKEALFPVSEICVDDIFLLSSGDQICADAVIISGECEVNESLITGESDAVFKAFGDELISGSFAVSGNAAAKVLRVGANSVSGRITSGAKYIKKPSSDIINAVNKIIKTVSFCVIPFGVILFLKAIFVSAQTLSDSVTTTVAALVSMIPEGLALLTSSALAVSSIRLAAKNALCRDLYCVEALARIDVLCLDKTRTITEGCLELLETLSFDEDFDLENALKAFIGAFSNNDPTLFAISRKFPKNTYIKPRKTVAFSSARKWSAANFEGFGTLVLGAPSFISGEEFKKISKICEKYTQKGYRVLALAASDEELCESALPSEISTKALLIFSDKIRPFAPAVFDYFKDRGVSLKIISGDDAKTVSQTAARAGLENAEKFIDVSKIDEKNLSEIVEKYAVFGRASPDMKLAIIKALKKNGRKTAMTGDGVNDVLALREADCSVTFGGASDAARAVSRIVLLNDDFSAMPAVFEEGRRCVNNIRRSAALFLVKTVFAFILAAVFVFLPAAYPLRPVQMTLVSALTIGAPSFLLALEPNKSRFCGGFLKSVMQRAAPCGISAALGIILIIVSQSVFGFSNDDVSTMSMYLLGASGFGTLFGVCLPFNKRRAAMFAALAAAFCAVPLIKPLRGIFYITSLGGKERLVTAVIIAIVWTFIAVGCRITKKIFYHIR